MGHSTNQVGDWQKGKQCFEKVLELNPEDKCSQVYVERCDYLLENGDPKTWDGIWVLTSK